MLDDLLDFPSFTYIYFEAVLEQDFVFFVDFIGNHRRYSIDEVESGCIVVVVRKLFDEEFPISASERSNVIGFMDDLLHFSPLHLLRWHVHLSPSVLV